MLAFLTYIADKTEGIIDEEHIITKPEELRSHSDILLNKDIQKSCQRYFTEDAWLCVLNTLKQLQGKCVLISKIIFNYNVWQEDRLKDPV